MSLISAIFFQHTTSCILLANESWFKVTFGSYLFFRISFQNFIINQTTLEFALDFVPEFDLHWIMYSIQILKICVDTTLIITEQMHERKGTMKRQAMMGKDTGNLLRPWYFLLGMEMVMLWPWYHQCYMLWPWLRPGFTIPGFRHSPQSKKLQIKLK